MPVPSKTPRVTRINQEYAYSLLTLVLAKRTEKDAKFPFAEKGMLRKAGKDMWLQAECEAGDYIIYVS